MVIEIIPKKAELRPPSLLSVLVYLSLILLIISLFVGLLLFLFQKNSVKTLQNIEENLAKKGTPEEKVMGQKILLGQKKINDFGSLINLHQSNLKFFTFFEKLTHPKVFFSKIDLKIGKGYISLSGTAENFEVLGQQILIFKKEKLIKNVDLLKISGSPQGRIEFTVGLTFDSQKFKY